MPRQAPCVREAVPGDAEALLALWSASARPQEGSPRDLDDARRALANMAANPDERVIVAEVDDVVVAALQLSRGQLSPLLQDSAVHTSFLMVSPDHRKHGYAHALMDAAVAWAEEKDVDQITAICDTNRDTNRFFARLGLSTVAGVRWSTTAALRKRLTAERGRASVGGNRHLVEVLAQRRSMRRRQGAVAPD